MSYNIILKTISLKIMKIQSFGEIPLLQRFHSGPKHEIVVRDSQSVIWLYVSR